MYEYLDAHMKHSIRKCLTSGARAQPVYYLHLQRTTRGIVQVGRSLLAFYFFVLPLLVA